MPARRGERQGARGGTPDEHDAAHGDVGSAILEIGYSQVDFCGKKIPSGGRSSDRGAHHRGKYQPFAVSHSLGDASGLVIAHLITRNRSLTQLSLNENKGCAIAIAILGRRPPGFFWLLAIGELVSNKPCVILAASWWVSGEGQCRDETR